MWLAVTLWFAVSAIASTYFNTVFLREFHGDFISHTLVRFLGSALLGSIANLFTRQDKRLSIKSLRIVLQACVMPAICLVSANVFNSLALDKGGITLTYVVKAGIPPITVLICFIFLAQCASWRILLTLMPIVSGVALAAVSDSEFTWIGFVAAWVSTIAQASLNVLSKSVIGSLNLSGQTFQFALASIGSIILLVVSRGGHDAREILSLGRIEDIQLFVLVAATYHVEYVLNFIVTDSCTQIQFAVLDVVRRLAIIVCGAIIFHKELSMLNVFGIVLALSGVLLFSLVKKSEEQVVISTRDQEEKNV